MVRCAARTGNLLLNVGPKPDGNIRKEERDRLLALGEWLAVNGEAIYDSERCALRSGMLGSWTRKGKTAYLHVLRWPGTEAVVPLVGSPIKSAVLLGSGEKLGIRRASNGRVFFNGLPRRPPHKFMNVIKVQFTEEPRVLEEPDFAAWLKGEA
jgi:alpha-L-fucosidase